MRSTTRLKQLIAAPELLVAPGVYDPLLAKLVQQAGFQAVYMTGAGVSHSTLGLPDLGLTSFSEMLTRAGAIAEAVDLPLIADADTGYGNALNVQRTVRAYERAGVAGLHLEDQALPKRCGHFAGKTLLPRGEMLGKLKAALDARVDGDLQIIARTDARGPFGFDAALERAQAYAEQGADVIFFESPHSEDELRRVAKAVDRPLLANMVEGGQTPLLSAEELQALGYALAIWPGAIGRFVVKQVGEFLQRARAAGTTRGELAHMNDFTEQNALLGLPHYLELAERYKG